MSKFGEPISDKSKMKAGSPPILFQMQPEGYVKLSSAADIKDWEDRLKQFYGIDRKTLGNVEPLDTCSGGCYDDCGGGPV